MSEQVLCAPGRYAGKVVDHDLGESGTGKDQIAIAFTFADADGKQHTLTFFKSITEETIGCKGGVAESLKALGWDPEEKGWALEEIARKSEENPNGGALMGAEASIVVQHKEIQNSSDPKKNGTKVAEIAFVNAPGGGLGMKKRYEGSQVADAVSRIRSLVGGGGAASGKPATASSGKPAAGKGALPF